MRTPSDGFDALEDRLRELRRSIGVAVEAPGEPTADPRESLRIVVRRLAIRAAGSASRVVEGSARRLRTVDRRVVIAAVAVALVLVIALVGGRPRTEGPLAGDDAGAVATEERTEPIRFPDPVPDALAPEERLRPVGVRSLAAGFEAAVVSVTDLPSCAATADATADAERVRWFDASGSDGRAVAPGEHGVALLMGAADVAAGAVPLAGIDRVDRGTVIEVARSNATVLAWRAIDVVTVPVGTPFPAELLAPAAEQRLVLVGCGVVAPDGPLDTYVLALRQR